MSDSFDRGITVTEIAPMDQPIDVAPETSVAFIGRTLRGPLHTPVRVRSFSEFKRRFGDCWTRSSLGPAIEQFFEHGGRTLHVVRVANNARCALVCLPAGGSALVLRAIEPGSTEKIRAAVDYDGITDDSLFNLALQRIDPDTGHVVDQELYGRVSYREGDENYVVDALLASDLVRAELPYPTHRPDATPNRYVDPIQTGSDGNALTDYDLIGSRTQGTGLFALAGVGRLDLLYMPPPGKGQDVGPAAMLAAERYCRGRHAMLIADPPADWAAAEDAVEGMRQLGLESDNLLGYFPRVRLRGDTQSRAAGGALAGLLCKIDRQQGRWSGLESAGVGLRRRWQPVVALDDEQARRVAATGLNPLTIDALHRPAFSGSVTAGQGGSLDPSFSSLATRRLCLGIASSVDRASRWAIFEQPGEALVERLKSQVHAFLAGLANQGAFEDDVFDVRCETRLCKADVNQANQFTLILQFRPVGCGKPISMTLHQSTSGCWVSPTAFAPTGE